MMIITSAFKKIKKSMAYLGLYTPTDYAKIKKHSRQYVNTLINKSALSTEMYHNRVWVRLDAGEHATKIYGENPIDILTKFSFTKRTKNIAISTSDVICEVKLLNSDGDISIRFYNKDGNAMLDIPANIRNHEICID